MGFSWQDSSESPRRVFRNPSGGPVYVRWGARDNDGEISTGFFTVYFNSPPQVIAIGNPAIGDTAAWTGFDYRSGKGSARISYRGIDGDYWSDSLAYTMEIGSDSSHWTTIYQGRDTTKLLTGLDSLRTYWWKITACDVFNQCIDTMGYFSTGHTPALALRTIQSAGRSFQMGSTADDDESPVHSVSFTRDFFIDSAEVTQQSYFLIMGANPSSFAKDSLNPVDGVTWFDAVRYCIKRSVNEGLEICYDTLNGWNCDAGKNGYRLPTEAEWEYGARAGTATEYSWGDTIDSTYCWYSANSGGKPHRTVTKIANGWGLYDCSGNAWEWCNDWYSAPFSSDAQQDPAGPSQGTYRVLKGGSWLNSAHNVRSASRTWLPPDTRNYNCGFRCARTR
jgi:formylglycine-generating enzyme required for sulfatase activity